MRVLDPVETLLDDVLSVNNMGAKKKKQTDTPSGSGSGSRKTSATSPSATANGEGKRRKFLKIKNFMLVSLFRH